MKSLIRKLSINKIPKDWLKGMPKEYLVVYRDGYDLLSKYELEELLLHPKKGKDIKHIFNWEDRLKINTVFEEVGE